jgi:hypothetical protein
MKMIAFVVKASEIKKFLAQEGGRVNADFSNLNSSSARVTLK